MNTPNHSGRSGHTLIPVRDYDLHATLTSGQAFRWRRTGDAWDGVVLGRWVRLTPGPSGLAAATATPCERWDWLTGYLQAEVNLDDILKTFPQDGPMQESIAACRGLRLLRQDPWECLASFICSSTKQIVQIQQIVELLCQRFGETVCADGRPAFAFPSAARLAGADERELRECKMGFRAPYVLAAARAVADGRLELEPLRQRPYAEARAALTELPGVGDKIANCVLLFAYGFQEAFPVDVWIRKALQELYFPRRRPSPQRLQRFVEGYFGPQAGYAQQYLFHFARTARKSIEDRKSVV